MSTVAEGVIGANVRRSDGDLKVRGRAIYAIDHEEARMLHARILRSPVAAGRVTRLDTTRAAALPGVHAIVTAADTPRAKAGWLVQDQILFAEEVVRYVGEPLAAVAADSEEQAEAALAAIELEIEPGPAAITLEQAVAEGAPLVHPDWESYAILIPAPRSGPGGNIAWEGRIDRGDVDADFARDDVTIVEDEYHVPRQHQAYIEPRAAVVHWENGRCIVHTTTQALYTVRDRVAALCSVPVSRVRVKMTAVGGGFGGKVDFHAEPFCALLSLKTGRPVKLVNTRRDEFTVGAPRENARVRIRTAVTGDGELVAREAEVLMDAGAYAGETAFCAAVGGLILGGNYRQGSLRLSTKVVYTNTASTGAYRGVGGLYLVFAQERHMDHIAEVLGIDRRELRLKNVLRDGDRTGYGEVLSDPAFVHALERLEEVAPWAEARARAEAPGRPLRGVGLALTHWITTPGPASVSLKLNEDGTVNLMNAGGESGSGSMYTGVPQIVAAELGIRPEDVIVLAPDSDEVGYDMGPQGGRTTFMVGNAARAGAIEIRDQVLETASALMEVAASDLELAEGAVRVVGSPDKSLPLASVAQAAVWTSGPIQGKGKYVAPPIPFDTGCSVGNAITTMNGATFHVHLAEVEVDPDTGKVTVTRYVVVQDVGKAINPEMIKGQIHGGVLQGIGYALYEGLHTLEDGSSRELDLEAYRLPTAFEAPPIEAILLEHPSPNGPLGVKGAGEAPILPAAAAVANAVSDAVGKPFDRLPITPFDVLAALGNVR